MDQQQLVNVCVSSHAPHTTVYLPSEWDEDQRVWSVQENNFKVLCQLQTLNHKEVQKYETMILDKITNN
jgi:hypothetical protein